MQRLFGKNAQRNIFQITIKRIILFCFALRNLFTASQLLHQHVKMYNIQNYKMACWLILAKSLFIKLIYIDSHALSSCV